MIQYCPVCLSEPGAYLRRGWRFSFEVACFNDGCFLLDSCWQCGALVDPLSNTTPVMEFVCVKCSAPLAKAPSLHLPDTVEEQEAIYAQLHRLAAEANGDVSWREYRYVSELSSARCAAPIRPMPPHATTPYVGRLGPAASGACRAHAQAACHQMAPQGRGATKSRSRRIATPRRRGASRSPV